MTRRTFTLFASCAFATGLAAPATARTVDVQFNASNFSDPLDIDNRYFPLIPGTTLIYKSESPDGCEEDHFIVTNDTKAIAAGVTARVVHDIAYEDPECDGSLLKVEETFDWHAQDNAGNVWYLGEDTRNCTPAGCTPGDGSWEAGVDGAVAGIFMLADPRKGDSYHQEFYEGHAEDQASINGLGVTVKLRRDDAIGPGTFSDCLVTKEWTTLDPGSIEHKSYCPAIGLVLVEEQHGKTVRFELTGPSDPFKFRVVR